jgi:hypothetical protein
MTIARQIRRYFFLENAGELRFIPLRRRKQDKNPHMHACTHTHTHTSTHKQTPKATQTHRATDQYSHDLNRHNPGPDRTRTVGYQSDLRHSQARPLRPSSTTRRSTDYCSVRSVHGGHGFVAGAMDHTVSQAATHTLPPERHGYIETQCWSVLVDRG